MPFIKSKVSVPLSKEQEAEIKTKIGKAIELVPGKSETYLLLEFDDNCRLWLRGKNNVSDFMSPEERRMDAEYGILKYCKRLAGIYKSEEPIGGLPINMEGFRLFDAEHRSSKPLNLAYKAAQLADPDRADTFLIELRHATVIDCLPTTRFDEIMKVVRKVGIDENSFKQFYQNGSAEKELEKDLEYTLSLGVHSLPAYLIQAGNKAIIMQSFEYQDFTNAIQQVLQ